MRFSPISPNLRISETGRKNIEEYAQDPEAYKRNHPNAVGQKDDPWDGVKSTIRSVGDTTRNALGSIGYMTPSAPAMVYSDFAQGQENSDRAKQESAQADAANQARLAKNQEYVDQLSKYATGERSKQSQYEHDLQSQAAAPIRQQFVSDWRRAQENASRRGLLGSSISYENYANLSEGAKFAFNQARSQIHNQVESDLSNMEQSAIDAGKNIASATTDDALKQYDSALSEMKRRSAGMSNFVGGAASVAGGLMASQPQAGGAQNRGPTWAQPGSGYQGEYLSPGYTPANDYYTLPA